MNAVENIASFAAVVLIAKAVGVSTSITALSATVFFYARRRALFSTSVVSACSCARTVAFTVAWIAFMTFAFELLRDVT